MRKFAYCAGQCTQTFCILCGDALTEAEHFSHFHGDPFGERCLNEGRVAAASEEAFEKHALEALNKLDATKGEAAAAAAGSSRVSPPPVQRASSDVYGKGASQYELPVLEKWRRAGELAHAAAKRADWAEAVVLYKRCTELRPDWAKGHACLEKAQERVTQVWCAEPARICALDSSSKS